MLGKIFGGKSQNKKSKNGFFLELDESAEEQSAKTKVKEAAKSEQETGAAVEEEKPEKAQKSVQKAKSTNNSVAKANSSATAYDEPFWIKEMYKKKEDKQEKEAEQTFATDYLMPTPTNYRRRPGPSLDPFKDMARQTKTPQ